MLEGGNLTLPLTISRDGALFDASKRGRAIDDVHMAIDDATFLAQDNDGGQFECKATISRGTLLVDPV